MPNERVVVRFEGSFTFEYDADSAHFKDTLQSYNESICKASELDILKVVVQHLISGRSLNEMIEGVGYVKKKGIKHDPYPFSGITIDDDTPNIEF